MENPEPEHAAPLLRNPLPVFTKAQIEEWAKSPEIREFGTLTHEIREIAAWLKSNDCQMAAMESTGSYWKPRYNIFEQEGLPVIVCNAYHIRNVPGRKTDRIYVRSAHVFMPMRNGMNHNGHGE